VTGCSPAGWSGTPLARGTTVAAHVQRTADGYALHLVHWAMDRWGAQANSAAHFPRLGPIIVTHRLPRPVTAATHEPAGTPLTLTQADDGACSLTVPALHVWGLIRLTV
jgi:hypothetical protein